jgi:RHS repeat-associated protein
MKSAIHIILFFVFIWGNVQVHAQCNVTVNVTNYTGCAGSRTLAATTNAAGVTGHRWYTAQTGGSLVSGVSQQSPASPVWISSLTANFTANTSYWVAPVCGSTEGTRTKVSFTLSPGISISTSGDPIAFCQGGTLTASGGSNYQWSLGTSSTDPNPTILSTATTITPSASGYYILKGTNSCGVQQTVYREIFFLPFMAASISPSGSGTVRIKYNGLLTASPVSPSYYYNWKKDGISMPTTSSTYTVTEGGVYTVSISNSGCAAGPTSTPVTIAINQLPTAGISPSVIDVIWPNNSVTISGTSSDPDGSVVSTVWTQLSGPNTATLSGTNTLILNVSNLVVGIYTFRLTVTDDTGESVMATVTVNVAYPANNYNWIKETVAQVPKLTTDAQVKASTVSQKQKIETWQYFDGLGRPIQTVSTQASPLLKDAVAPIDYDALGREAVKYLPYVSGNTGWYKDNFLPASHANYATTSNAQYQFYQNTARVSIDEKPYAETRFEPSPVNRVLEQGAPGADWQPDATNSYTSTDRTIKKAREFNLANEVLLWTYTYPTATYQLGLVNAGTVSAPVYYAVNQLYKNKTKDEQHHEVIEYVDKGGRTVLKRVQVSTTSNASTTDANKDTNWASTYYIYDDFGNLVCVISPEATKLLSTQYYHASATDATKDAFLNRWAFRYTYDSRKRMSYKQVPGTGTGSGVTGTVYMVYDDLDRLVLTQDGNQRASMQWTFIKYDELNRPIATGIKDTTAILGPADMQAGISKHYAKSWTRYGETYVGNVAGNISGYSNKSYPTVTVGTTTLFSSYRTITYYDNYAFKNYVGTDYDYLNENLSEPASNYTYTQPTVSLSSVIGQVTGTRVRVLDDHIASSVVTWLNSVNYYDDKYRVIQVLADNYRGGRDRVSNVYDFAGKVLKTKTTHYGISWKDVVAARRMGNRIDKTGVDGWGNSGAASVEMLPIGQDGWFEFSTSANNKALVIGLSETNVDANWTTIKYALYLTSLGKLEVRENGGSTNLLTSSPPYSAGDIFRIERKQGRIYFYQNGIYLTDRAATSNALLIDFAMYGNRAVIGNLRSSFGSFNPYQITRRYTYDHASRLTHIWHKIGTQPEILLSKNEYNELGQLIDKKLHSTNADATDAKQSVDYRYNIRGWLTSLNNAELSNDGMTNDEAGDYFGMNLAYNEDLGTSATNAGSTLKNVQVSSYPFTGNANDATANGLNGVVHGAQLTTDSQGNSASAYTFTASDYIEIPNSQIAHSFIPNTGKFTIAAFIKITDLDARSVFVSNTATSNTKGFAFMYETYGVGYGDHQLRFIIMTGAGASAYFTGLGGVRTINDTNWHHVAVVGDGMYVRFYVDGVLDGSPVAITAFSSGAMSSTTLIGKTRSGGLYLGMAGSIDEVNILNRPSSQSEIQALANRGDFDSAEDGRQYNGNISAMKWSVNQGMGDVKEMAYNFKYDPLNRLISAKNLQSSVLGTWSAGQYHEGDLSYDMNGNIKTLSRFGLASTAMDNLSYTYATGNQLTKVADTGDKYRGFLDGVNTDNDYAYDVNGNMTIDKNKGITTAITYNMLNLPNTVTRGLNNVNYIYDATGRKLAQATYFLNSTTQTDYAGEFQYVNDALQFIQHEEGRVVLANEKLIYTNDGADLTSVTAYNGTTISSVKLSGNQDYIKVLSNGTTLRGAMFGGVLPAQPGERYRIKIKGYRVGSGGVNILARTNKGDILWGSVWNGSQMPASSTTESWIEETVTIPTGGTQLEVGLQWGTTVATDYFVVSGVEVTKLGVNTTPEYQYNLKDHLGNIRLTFTSKVEELQYTAKFEDGSESQNFENYSSVSADMFDHTDAGTAYTKAQLLNGGQGSQVGVAKTFAVVPGDVVKAEVYAKYLGTRGSAVDPTTFGAALLSAFNLSTPVAGEAGTASAALSDYGAFIGGNGNPGIENWPKGWLNILVFDKDYNLVDIAFQQLSSDYVQEVGSLTKAPHELLSKQVTIKQSGYVYIYVSNEGSVAQEVYFDDLLVTHVKSPVIQAEDYYPFGLTFNNYQRENGLLNQYQYNGKESQKALDLNWLDYGARMYMSEIGRWTVIDPMNEKFFPLSGYNYVANNPALLIDPNGEDWTITATEDETGRKQYYVNFTAAVLNSSSNKKIDMAAFAIAVMEQMESLFDQTTARKDGTLDFDVSFNSSIRVVNDKKDIAKDETTIEIKDSNHKDFENKNPKVATPAVALNGKEISVNEAFVGDMINGKNSKTMPHEAGHTAGLRHPLMDINVSVFGLIKEKGVTYNSPKTNFMYQGRVKTPTGPTREQMERMLRLYNSDALNKSDGVHPVNQN